MVCSFTGRQLLSSSVIFQSRQQTGFYGHNRRHLNRNNRWLRDAGRVRLPPQDVQSAEKYHPQHLGLFEVWIFSIVIPGFSSFNGQKRAALFMSTCALTCRGRQEQEPALAPSHTRRPGRHMSLRLRPPPLSSMLGSLGRVSVGLCPGCTDIHPFDSWGQVQINRDPQPEQRDVPIDPPPHGPYVETPVKLDVWGQMWCSLHRPLFPPASVRTTPFLSSTFWGQVGSTSSFLSLVSTPAEKVPSVVVWRQLGCHVSTIRVRVGFQLLREYVIVTTLLNVTCLIHKGPGSLSLGSTIVFLGLRAHELTYCACFI